MESPKERKVTGRQNIFEKLIAKKFPNVMKIIHPHRFKSKNSNHKKHEVNYKVYYLMIIKLLKNNIEFEKKRHITFII